MDKDSTLSAADWFTEGLKCFNNMQLRKTTASKKIFQGHFIGGKKHFQKTLIMISIGN